EVGEVDRLGAVGVGDRARRAARPVQGAELGLQAVDRQRRAPVSLVAGTERLQARRVELDLQEGRAGVVGPRRGPGGGIPGWGGDPGAPPVALLVAQDPCGPGGDSVLEGPHRAGEAAIRLASRLDRELDLVALAAPGAGLAGEELGGGLVVADVVAVVLEAVLAVGGDLRAVHAAPDRLLDQAVAVAVQPAPRVDVLLDRASRPAMCRGRRGADHEGCEY